MKKIVAQEALKVASKTIVFWIRINSYHDLNKNLFQSNSSITNISFALFARKKTQLKKLTWYISTQSEA